MFASVLRLSIEDLTKLRVKDAYGVHRVVYDLFERVRDEAAMTDSSSGILYADRGVRKERREIVMVSDRCPRQPPHGEVQCREIPEKFLGFSTYRFQITINPVRRESSSGKLVPLRNRESVAEWFAAKSPGWGFDITHIEVQSLNVLQFEKEKGQRVTLGQATLTGILHVRDVADFSRSFSLGIGRGKAFGCGLLQIEPIVNQPPNPPTPQ